MDESTANMTIEKCISIRPYLDVFFELSEIDFLLLVRYLDFDIPDDKFKSLDVLWPFVLSSFFNYFYKNDIKNNKNTIRDKLQKAYTHIKFIQKAGHVTEQGIFELLIQYTKGLEQNKYKNLKSFQKVLENSEYDPKYFKELYKIFRGYWDIFNRKMPLHLIG